MEASVPKLSNVVVAVLLVIGIFASIGDTQALCNVPSDGLMACKPAATAPNPPPPSATCCAALSHADFTCLCSYKNSPVLPAVGIDPKLAMQLPQKCKLPNPANC